MNCEPLILHALRVKGICTDERLVAATGLTGRSVQDALTELIDRELVVRRSGRISGAMLTPRGRERHAEILPTLQCRANEIMTAYEDFLSLNARFKEACADWQGYPTVRLLGRIVAVQGEIDDVLARVGRLEPRFESYRARLRTAMRRFREGHSQALLQPGTESYHDIWMELHQDLLLTLGRSRADEHRAVQTPVV